MPSRNKKNIMTIYEMLDSVHLRGIESGCYLRYRQTDSITIGTN